MKLTSTNKRTHTLQAIDMDRTQPHVQEALRHLPSNGDEFFYYLAPSNLGMAEMELPKRFANKQTRSTAIIIKCYGDKPTRQHLTMLFVWLNYNCNARWSDGEIGHIVATLINTEEARLMDYTLLCLFVKWVADGHASLYDASCYRVMQAFQEYRKVAASKRMRMEADAQALAQNIDTAPRMTWREYANAIGRSESSVEQAIINDLKNNK